jgi:hypothetical protein
LTSTNVQMLTQTVLADLREGLGTSEKLCQMLETHLSEARHAAATADIAAREKVFVAAS